MQVENQTRGSEQQNKADMTMTINIDQDVFIGLWPAAWLTYLESSTLTPPEETVDFFPKCSY